MKKGGNGQREYYAAGKRASEALSFLMWMFRVRKQKHRRTAGVWGWVVFWWHFFKRGKEKNVH